MSIARAIARTPGLADADKVTKINQYFNLIGQLDEFHDSAEITGRLYGDMGKLIYNGTTNSYNTGFIKGLFHQLDFLADLRDAGKNVEALEKSVTLANTQRYVDVVADSGRKFELKNFSHYTGDNIKNVVKGFDKELAQAMALGDDDLIKAAIQKIHFVFRGNPTGAELMLEEVKKAGLKKLRKSTYPEARKLFEQQMDDALAAVTSGITKKIPDVGEMFAFQGKVVPF